MPTLQKRNSYSGRVNDGPNITQEVNGTYGTQVHDSRAPTVSAIACCLDGGADTVPSQEIVRKKQNQPQL